MKDKLNNLENIIQGYVATDSVSGERYRYLMENMETVLYAIQQARKVEEMQKALERIATSKKDSQSPSFADMISHTPRSYLHHDEMILLAKETLQSIKGGETE